MIALGLIETHGFVAAVAAADAMLKAANVYLLERSIVPCGLVTISIASKDIGSVKAAIETGAAQVLQMGGRLISKHVIARPNIELENILSLKQNVSIKDYSNSSCCGMGSSIAASFEEKTMLESNAVENFTTTKASLKEENLAEQEIIETKFDEVLQKINAVVEAHIPEKTPLPISIKSQKKYTRAELKRLSLLRLREIALAVENFSLSKEQIVKTNKNVLISALLKI